MVLDFVRKVLNNNNDNGDKTLELSNGIRNNGDNKYSMEPSSVLSRNMSRN